MKCKKSLMGLAALLILIFHFYIPFTGNSIEQCIYKASYLGVDIFFFLSAYSISRRGVDSYPAFVKNRFITVYIPFILFSIVGAVYGKWEITRFFKVILGVEFFNKGGGAFLWFFAAIMIMYLITPFLLKIKDRLGLGGFVLTVSIWMIIAITVEYVFKYKPLFILINRLPVFAIGLYYDRVRNFFTGKKGIIVSFAGLIAGAVLIYEFAGVKLLNKPVYNMYYIVVIPFVFSLIAVCDSISEKSSFKNVPLCFVGEFTLELYAIQMLFGYKIETAILGSMTALKPLAFLFTAIILIFIAWIVYITKRFAINCFNKK